MIWWFSLVQKLALFAFREQIGKLNTTNARLTLEKVLLEKDLGYLRLENERLKAELLDSVMQSKILIDKIGTPAPAKDQKAIKRLMAQEDPFGEDATQPDVFVSHPDRTPAEIGEDIASAFTKQG